MTSADRPERPVEGQTIMSNGAFIDLGGLWVRYDTIGTVKPTEEGEPACLVVLTLPGYKTLRVGCTATALLSVIEAVADENETAVGLSRAKGMRQ
jgi:hypothetical protein